MVESGPQRVHQRNPARRLPATFLHHQKSAQRAIVVSAVDTVKLADEAVRDEYAALAW